MTRLGIVTGLSTESACIQRAAAPLPEPERPLTFSAGGSAERAREGAERLLAEGADALVSFGIAGGLDPRLRAGAVVLADAVLDPDGGRILTDQGWRDSLRRRAETALPVTVAALAGVDRVVVSAADKRARFRATGAVAVDMESHGVARAAAAAGVPFLVLRAVADPAEGEIPWAARSIMAPDGRVNTRRLAARLAVRPWQIVPLYRLARDSRAALGALGRVAALDPARLALV